MDKKILATALIAAGLGTAAIAQEAQPGQPGQPVQPEERGQPGELGQPGDFGQPGAVPEEELAVLPEFASIDANSDGMIDEGETESLTQQLEDEHQVEFQFETADRNSDGLINNQEYVAYDAMLKERLGIA